MGGWIPGILRRPPGRVGSRWKEQLVGGIMYIPHGRMDTWCHAYSAWASGQPVVQGNGEQPPGRVGVCAAWASEVNSTA